MNAGQLAILNGFLSQYHPSDSFDTDRDHVLTTDAIMAQLADMADFSANEVAEHMANAGFRFKPETADCGQGWILRYE